MLKEPFLSAIPVLERLIKNGYEAFFVGGSVRDYLIGREIGDIDIATSASPNVVTSLFPQYVPIGIEHGTILVHYNNNQYEVTTFRKEGKYEDFRRPNEVDFIQSVEDDLGRRDFTVNAIAMDIAGNIIDPYGGRKDLEKKIIRTVGTAQNRFAEDPLRMMRALRFVSQLGFSLDEDTKSAITSDCSLLRNIAIERIKIEFEKLLLGSSPCQALLLLAEIGVYRYLPCLTKYKQIFVQMSRLPLTSLTNEREHWALLFFLLYVDEKAVEQSLKQWKASNAMIKDTVAITSALHLIVKNGWTSRVMYELGKQLTLSTARVHAVLQQMNVERTVIEISRKYGELPIKSKKEIAVSGTDLLAWSVRSPGPWLSQALAEIETLILKGMLTNDRMEIKRWLKCNLRSEKNF